MKWDAVEDGELECTECAATYPIRRCVPRFVAESNYADSFGVEWTVHARTQCDSYSGRTPSRKRFFKETNWPADLRGEVILEVGSGSGRFTEVAVQTGAFLVSFDYSAAVDANYANNGANRNLLIVQADVNRMPFRDDYFDRLFCFGVLQHTPDPRASFLSLPRVLKPGGALVADVYQWTLGTKIFGTKYLVRALTRRMEPRSLYALVRRWIDLVWPVARPLLRVPFIGRRLVWRLFVIQDYSVYGLDEAKLKEWAYLDTYDVLASHYDNPQRLEDVREWFRSAGLDDAEVEYGYSGIQGRARKPNPTEAG